MGKTKALLARYKTEIAKFVNITDMGELHWILGIEVCQIHEGLETNLHTHGPEYLAHHSAVPIYHGVISSHEKHTLS